MSNAKNKLNKFFAKNNFFGSFNEVEKIPNKDLAECCFIGRSNVGKSSLINSITNNKKLARTSKTPGRTQSVNLIGISKIINLIDLPGYGYAKVSKNLREELALLIEAYISTRQNLLIVFVLIDSKVGIKDSDIDILDLINSSNKKIYIILTKTDKCAKNFVIDQKKSILTLMNNYNKNFVKILTSSSKRNEGIFDIQKEIFNLSKIA
jgi:GTP-binding protein